MNSGVLRGLKVAGGVVLVGLGLFFALHHGIFLLGILVLPGGYLIWDGVRKPKAAKP